MSKTKLTKAEIKTIKLRIAHLEETLADEGNWVARFNLVKDLKVWREKLAA